MRYLSGWKATVGIYVLSAFVAGAAQQPATGGAEKGAVAPAVTPAATDITTTGGVNGYLSVFTGASTIVDSIVYQGTSGIGIGRIPNAMLDVNGKSIFRGAQVLSRTGDATTSAGAPSFGLTVQSSVYNTSTKSNLLPYYQLQSEPTGNNTATTGATYNFLYYSGIGANPVETGLYFNPNGTIHFSPAQTFPISAGPQGAAGPAGPQGPTGQQGPTGPQGPQGPQGVSGFTLPYSASQGFTGVVYPALLTLENTNLGGDAIAGYGGQTAEYGPTGGAGLYGEGGLSDGASGKAGPGVVGQGGDATSPFPNAPFGGDGGDFTGGDSVSGGDGSAGDGLDVFGGDSDQPRGGGTGIFARGGSNAVNAGFFEGNVQVDGNVLTASGSSVIDHPLDPANKYLSHSFVESPDMMNIYNGNIVTDGRGEAVVSMPDWFEALNRDFRYQLTTIGQPAQAYIASEMSNRTFVIKTDRPNVKVSWQVTGVRQDAWANAHRIPVNEDKPENERGHYIHPELFGHAGEPSIAEMRHPRPAKKRTR